MSAGLQAHGVAPATAHHVATLPPVSILFAAFLGYNPVEHLLGPHVLAGLSAHDQAGAHRPARSSPTSSPGRSATGSTPPSLFAIVACLIAAAASLLRGGRMVHDELHEPAAAPIPRRLRTADSRSSMQVEWYGQSAFRLTDGATTVVHRPLRRPRAAGRARPALGLPGHRRRRGRPRARHPRAPRPQRRRGDRRRPGDPALDRRAPGVADRRGARRRLRARRGRRHRARPEHALRLHARRAARRAPRRPRPGARCATSRRRRWAASTSSSSRSAAGRRSAPSRRRDRRAG